MERSIDQIADRQLGLLTRDQLIGYRAAIGHLVEVHPGVYRVPEAQVSFNQIHLAALLAAGYRLDERTTTRCVVSHRAAAVAHGFKGVTAEVPEITIPHHRRITVKGVVVYRTRVLDRRDVRELGPLLVTTPARTLVDLSGVLGLRALDEAVDDALCTGLTTLDDLRATFERRGARKRRGIRGIGDIRVLIRLKERQGVV